MTRRRAASNRLAILCLACASTLLVACSAPPARTPGSVPLRTPALSDSKVSGTEVTSAGSQDDDGSDDAKAAADHAQNQLDPLRSLAADGGAIGAADALDPTSRNQSSSALIAARNALDADDPALARALLETPIFGEPLAEIQREQLAQADPSGSTAADERPRPPEAAALQTLLTEQSAAGLYAYGLALEAQGFHTSAAKAFAAYGQARPVMEDIALMAVGNASFAAGDAESASKSFGRSLDLTTDSQTRFLAALRLGNSRLRAYAPDGAIQAYRQALNFALDDNQQAQALAGIIAAELEAGRPEAARKARLRIVREMPGAALAPAALARLKESGVSVGALDEARVIAGAGDHWAALTLLDEAMRNMASPPSEWQLEVARQYAALGEHAQAASAAEGAMSLPADDPLAPELAWEGARALQRLGRYSNAGAQFRTLAERWPGHARAADALWQLAWIKADSGAFQEAETAFAALAALYPDYRDADEAGFRAGYVAWMDGRGNAASQRWTEVAQTQTGEARARALYWLGRQAFDQGDRPSAETRWIQASAADPIGYYGQRARERAGIAPEAEAPTSSTAQGPNPGIKVRTTETEAWLATWRSSPGDLDASRAEIDASQDTRRAQAWLELGERDAASRALRKAIGAHSRDPAGLVALAERAILLDLPEVSVAAAASVLLAAPPDRRQAAPISLSRLAYPAPHLEFLLAETEPRSISTHLMLGLVRQESRFSSTALSPTGALGLTQVMPATGQQIAGWLGDSDFDLSDLNEPAVSLRYGAAYLGAQLDRFDGRTWPALAAYNGGPGNADRWFAESGDDQDRFVEEIDFRETRRYVQLVLAQVAQYARIYPELGR